MHPSSSPLNRRWAAVAGGLILICAVLQAATPLAAKADAYLLRRLEAAEAAKARFADREALALYEEVLRLQPDHPTALWNAAYLHIRIGWLEKDDAGRRRNFEIGHDYASRIFARQPDSYEAQLVMGAAKAKLAEYLGSGEKVRAARELEAHARFLLKQRADNPDVWYLYAWWHFEIARVSTADRFFAALLFGGLPSGASTEQAIACLQKAIALRPDYSAYHHDLGLFYERTGDLSKAREMYRTAIHLPPRAPEDSIFIEKARKRLARLNS
jgi:tetratricopeptide (TPR) repeat protein